MYLTRIAGIEPMIHHTKKNQPGKMYLTRIAGIEPIGGVNNPGRYRDVSYPHSGN